MECRRYCGAETNDGGGDLKHKRVRSHGISELTGPEGGEKTRIP
jgi:hypothetical protein